MKQLQIEQRSHWRDALQAAAPSEGLQVLQAVLNLIFARVGQPQPTGVRVWLVRGVERKVRISLWTVAQSCFSLGSWLPRESWALQSAVQLLADKHSVESHEWKVVQTLAEALGVSGAREFPLC